MDSKAEIVFTGSGVSSGVVLGQALKIDSHNRLILRIQVDDVRRKPAGICERSKRQRADGTQNHLKEK
jgi:hypothetical protein